MKLEEIKNICNLGTGTMGFGTALLFAQAGYKVRMFGRSPASIERGMNSIKGALQTYVENGIVQPADVAAITGRITGVTTLAEAAEGADFVIESVAENLEVKRQVFAEMDRLCPAHTIFATNTSGLSPTAIAEAVRRQDKFVVAHFWNPAHLMALVEVVPGKHTAPETVDITWRLIEKIGKKPVALKREALGFIGNRLQLAMIREALYIVEQGIASQEAVDTAVEYSLGRRYGVTGPLASADLGGLDIFYNISSYLLADLCNDPKPSRLLAEKVQQGQLGAKTGKGLYDWPADKLADINQKRAANLISWLRKDKGLQD